MELINITTKDKSFITKLTQNKKIVKYVDNGEEWDEEKIDNFINFNDSEQTSDNPHQYYYKIVVNNEFVGIIGIFLLAFFNGYYTNVLISPNHQRKGYFYKSLALLQERMKQNNISRDKIFLLVHPENERLLDISSRHYYYNQEREIEEIKYKEYIFFTRDYTYLYLSPEKDKDQIKKIFQKRGNWRPYDFENERGGPDFLYTYLDFKYDKRTYSLKSLLKNVTLKSEVKMTNKNLLFQELEKIPQAKKYLPSNNYINTGNINYKEVNNLFEKHKTMIFKPVYGYAGIAIEIFDKFEDFRNFTTSKKFSRVFDVIKESNVKKDITSSKYKDWVLQEYIDNPMLIDGKKFHIRGYYLVYQNKKYLMKTGEIFLANQKFTLGDYQNRDIHDTHSPKDDNLKFYPKDLKVSKKIEQEIQRQIEDLFHLVGRVDETFKCYSESKDCYQLFGFDVMVTQDYKVKMIEINGGPRMLSANIDFGRQLFENQMILMVDSVFPPKNKVEKDSDFIQVY